MNISKRTQNLFYLGVIILSIIVMIILGTTYMIDKKSATDEASGSATVATLKKKEDKVKITVSTETIQDGLTNMGVLITEEYYFTQVETYTKEKKVLFGINSSSEFVYSYDGKVMAGIDFEQIEIEKDDEKKTITVKIPHSTIQSTTIDTDTFKVYSEKESLWNPLKLEDYNMSLSEFEDAAQQKALDNDILEKADDQAQKLIRNFIGNFPSASGYEIKFEWRNSYES
jgi:hypothetical protein